MARDKARAKLAASFVVVVAGACSKNGKPPEEQREARTSVHQRPDGSCWLQETMSCPEGATCNPPPPREVDCPAEQRRPEQRVLPEDARRPPGKEGWLRVKEAFWASSGRCSYTGDALCPPPGKPGTCAGGKSVSVACRAEDAGALVTRVDAFKAERATGGCVAYPSFECGGGQCDLPAPAYIDCSAPLPREPTPEPQKSERPPFSASVRRDPSGECKLYIQPSCPPDVICNPPPPAPVDCPKAERSGGAADGGIDDARPAGKEGWLRVKPTLVPLAGACSYEVDRFCPPPGAPGSCDDYRRLDVRCLASGSERPKPPAGKDDYVFVPAFTVPRAAGGCFSYPALWCERGRQCELPAARAVDCALEPN